MFEHPPRLSRLLLVVEKNGKAFESSVKNDNETISVNFSRQNCGSRAKNDDIFGFSWLSNILSENLHYLENYYL